MRRRSTYIHDPSIDVNPDEIQVTSRQLLLGGLKAAREERLTFGYDELPAELREVLQRAHELHVRWAPEHQYDTVAPFLSRISPGLHVHYTSMPEPQDHLLCPLLQKAFSSALKCKSPYESFIRTSLVSERFATTATLQYYSLLPSLSNFVAYIQRHICTASDLSCMHTASLLNIADSVDLDYDAISHALVLTAFWSKPPAVFYDPIGEFTTYDAWNLDVSPSVNGKVEVGILSTGPAIDAHDLKLSGFLTVVGEDDHPKPTLFSFPSRHHSLPPEQSIAQTYSASFKHPQGLHPTLQITFPSGVALQEPSNRPQGSQCALQAYVTMPSHIFIDENAFLGGDALFQKSHNIRHVRAIAGNADLEAPDYLVDKWGSTLLFEPAVPDSPEVEEASSSSSSSSQSPEQQQQKDKSATKPWNVTVPMHLRYLAPAAGGYSTVELPWPIVYWACTAEEGTKFPVNPFDRSQLGYEGLYGPRTMFYHLKADTPAPENTSTQRRQRLVSPLVVPVYNTTATIGSPGMVEMGTVSAIIVGFAWVCYALWPGLVSSLREGGGGLWGETRKTRDGDQKKKKQ